MECLRFFVSGQTWACGLLASEAAAHNLKGERAPVALCREPTEAAAETVGSNPAPATKDPRFCYLGFSFVFCWTSPTFTVSISAVAVQPALFFLQNGQQRTTPELLGSGVVFRLDPYLTHTVFPWVWVKLWSGYRRIPAPGIFLTAPSAPKPRPFSWLPPAGRWW